MAKRRPKGKDKLPVGVQSEAAPFNSAFGGLAALRAQMGPAAEAKPEPEPATAAKPAGPPCKLGNRVVLQKERKGHGGKTVTRVRTLTLPAAELEALAKDLKRSLGCGARTEDSEIILQGDIADRAAVWFKAQGVRKVVVSG